MCNLEIKCRICGKKPHEISKYVYCANDEGIEPEEYVKKEEGTFILQQENSFVQAVM